MTTGATSYRRGSATFERIELDRFALPALVLAVAASGLLLFHLTRGSSFWVDDWNFIIGRRGNSVNTFLSPYQGHLSLVPVAVYRLLFAAFGIGSYTPYRVVVIGLSLVVALLLFGYARRRVGDLSALLLTTLMLFLGPGWQNTMWAFQTPWLIVAAAGIGALMMLDRRDRRGDIAACVLILVAVCSTSVGIAFAIGIAVDIALIRRRWRDAWIVAIPLALYAIWALHYHPSPVAWSAVTAVPINVAKAAAAGLSALIGISGIAPFNQDGTALVYGLPLLVLGVILGAWRAAQGKVTPRVISLLVILVTFVAMVTLVRAGAILLSSRYVYFYCLLVALLIAELARGTRPSFPVQIALVAVCCFALVSDVGSLRAFGAYMRESGGETDAALSVLQLDRNTTPPHTLARVALYPYERLPAGAYFAASDALGTPAYTVAQLRHADGNAQATADAQLLGDGDATLVSSASSPGAATSAAGAGAPPPVAGSENGTAVRAGSCIRFVPVAALAPGLVASVSLMVVPGRLSVTSAAAPATVSIRRFAPTFTSLGSVAAHGTATLTVRRDPASQPWYLELSSIAPVRACTVGP